MHPDFRADLHCHTTCSDGSDKPLAVLQKAKAANLQALSITDHDTIDAYTPELFTAAQNMGIHLLPGIEISSELDAIPVHILGYGFDLHSQKLKSFLRDQQQKRGERNRNILKKLSECNMPIQEEELFALGPEKTLGRPHIAELMVKKGYVPSIEIAFELYLRDGARCYASGMKHLSEEIIDVLHASGGIAVLAHPHFYKKRTFVQKLLAIPFDGIECYYAALPKAQELPWIQIAKERNWIATGGSDYHGDIKPHISLGCSWVGRETFEEIQRKVGERHRLTQR